MSERAAILLAGGAGTRLWPLSTEEEPKQFLRLFDGRSLLQIAFDRIRRAIPAERIFVSTHERHRAAVAAQLPSLAASRILVEPSRRNTAPAIATCCADVAALTGGDPIVGIFPSDHYIADEEAFIAVVERAYAFAAAQPYLLTIGIDPDHPNTGFGWLELGEELEPDVIRLVRFVEKPPLEKAEEFVRAGTFVWNGGMFVWRESTFQGVLRAIAPELAKPLASWSAASQAERRAIYETLPATSIDYAVMEKAPNVATVRGEFGWSDVGSWKAVAKIIGRGREEGVVREDADSVLVHADGRRPVVVVGVDGVAIVDAPEGLLVIRLDDSERLSAIVKRLRQI